MTHKKIPTFLKRCSALALIVSGIAISSCNSKEDTPATDNYLPSESVAVTAFSLSPDIRVMRNLDSVFFSIDLEHAVIFNADSLPKGTNVTKLTPKITYPSSVTSATITMSNGTHREGTVNYRTNSTDTIDFTGDVTLTLATSGNAIMKTYTLKVNVHKEDPDTIYWERMASMELPSRMREPLAQKAVEYGSGVVCLLQEQDGSYTLSSTSDIFGGIWNKQELQPGFTPVISSLTASPTGLFMLSDEGELMASADGTAWTAAASGWSAIIGMYGPTLLGTATEGNRTYMTCYPSGTFPAMEMPAEFPMSGFTRPIEFTNRWTPDPTIVVFGGYPYPSGGTTAAWAFDGSEWVNIAETSMPALSGLSVVSYYSYLKNATNGLLKEFEVYLAFGGLDREGNVNNTIYVSYDHGINWQKAQRYMQFPEGVQAGYMVDALALGTTMQSNLSNQWKVAPRRIPFEVNGDVISWECPYIFLFGGYDADMKLIPRIRSGVLQRLTFAPLF